MKRFIALALVAALVAVPGSAVAGKGKGKNKGKVGHSAKAQNAKGANKHGKSRTTGFGGAYQGEISNVCDGVGMCTGTAVADVVGALGKGTATLSFNFTWDDATTDEEGVTCTSVSGGDVVIDAARGELDATVSEGSACESDEGFSYRLQAGFSGGSVKGRSASGGTLTIKGAVAPDSTTGTGNFSGKASF